ncbi:MAG: hypothetical protein K5637_04670 [Lachnospiraceae bacterium]|nr:hypothetical protein [Lachnospiraceae bacterium]
MLNQDKIALMTRAAAYEQHEGRKDLRSNRFFFGSYVRWNTLKGIVFFTIAYVLIAGVYLLCNTETLFSAFAEMDFRPVFEPIITYYIILVIIYAAICVACYIWKFFSSRDRVRDYYRTLKRIEKCNREEQQ